MDECRKLAREGEQCIKFGDLNKGIEMLEKALAVGIDDVSNLPLLSAIYSQLGNAYYAQNLYDKALTYHGNDLMLSRVQKDLLQQANAYSNLSATYTMLNNFNQAITCSENVTYLGRKLENQALECRGLFNLGFAHLQHAIHNNLKKTDEYLMEAIKNFELYLEVAKDIKNDLLSCLAIGNLANAYFYLGNYEKSILFHYKRLDIARSLGDKASMRRSFTNMGNAYIMMGNHEEAIKCYNFALELATEAGLKNVEAQILFSLGSVDFLRKDYNSAVLHYIKHLRLARLLKDNAGIIRSNWSLATAFAHLNHIPKSLYFLAINYNIAKQLSDDSMKKNTLNEIRQLIKRDPASVVSENQIYLDSSFDPDNISTEEVTFNMIGYSNNEAPKNCLEVLLNDGTSLCNSSTFNMPSLSVSLSLESFIKDCAKGSSSTPKRINKIPLSGTDLAQPTSKYIPQENLFVDSNLSKTPMYKSMPIIESTEAEDEENYDDFMDRIIRAQCKRINDQRASPKIFKDCVNDFPRHTGTLSSKSISGNVRKMTFGDNIKMMGNTLKKNVSKPFNYNYKNYKSGSAFFGTLMKPRQSLGGISNGSDLPSKRRFSLYGTLPKKLSISQKSFSKSIKKIKTGKTKFEQFENTNEEKSKFEEIQETENQLLNKELNTEPEKFKNSTFRVPDISVKKRFDRLKSSKSISAASKSPASSYSSLPFSHQLTNLMQPQEQLNNNNNNHNPETILDLIETIQGRRMNEQRANLVLPGLNNPKQLLEKFNFTVRRHSEGHKSINDEEKVDERLYELIVQSQSDRLEDQRSELGGRSFPFVSNTSSVNEEMVLNLVEKMQVGRIENQRALLGSSSTYITPKSLNKLNRSEAQNACKRSQDDVFDNNIEQKNSNNAINMSKEICESGDDLAMISI